MVHPKLVDKTTKQAQDLILKNGRRGEETVRRNGGANSKALGPGFVAKLGLFSQGKSDCSKEVNEI